MLKKWLHKVLPGKSGKGKPRVRKEVIPFSEHKISADQLSFAAEKVVRRLHNEGYEAYVVGGAVRDLLLGIEPKDFDVATNATPEQVRKVFRRSRIIGRRFQIVHVMIGPETIEVTTFRGGGKVQQNEHGRIMKDNTYGSMEEDAMRRDFTCNALYYDPIRQQIIDFHHGVSDVRARKLVMIGNPAERYQEDPVRVLRAVRLSGKLGFEVERNTAEPIPAFAGRLKQEPVARLFDEIMKLLFSGHAGQCLQQMNTLGIPGKIHPLLNALQHTENGRQNIVSLALRNTDERLRADKSVSVGFVLAAVLWPQLNTYWQKNMSQGQKPVVALNNAIGDLRDDVEKGWGVPQRFAATMREIWQLQPQFDNRKGARPHRLIAQQRFRAAYDFLTLRGEAGEVDGELVQWWTKFQHADDEIRMQMTAVQQKRGGETSGDKPKRKRRRKPKQKIENSGSNAG
ncbi:MULTISPECIES: polynucleotide adenylyltransferase PcnB [unclassified Neisseria]|uniref:polynucleotide adenylyltransferase PcnB n=1 Tax=unclassified Neisseria TaxID=2623750 RepID=UPI002665E8E8|nr:MULTISPECIES: polynucleotide adenylyltransferase PcnB [unclassified Neisseria]MDO1509012.1 polynucleotide adenylyltransferase PcnB [Neisseria sp. MVDL19-042950]MDO1515271.1 polynucleotide adenylyltransferase PcnB [Neisseria sp. MVDL18-041461]MDO1562631.1 polynucleotide adenylyltransferase PcnB [Neisseria sp. MVDL20-010259]